MSDPPKKKRPLLNLRAAVAFALKGGILFTKNATEENDMSSGKNLSQRQRRGRTIFPPAVFLPPKFTITAVDTDAHNLELEFSDATVVALNEAAWIDCCIAPGGGNILRAVTAIGPNQYRLHFQDEFALDENFTCKNAIGAIIGFSGAAIQAFSMPVGVGATWPPTYTP